MWDEQIQVAKEEWWEDDRGSNSNKKQQLKNERVRTIQL